MLVLRRACGESVTIGDNAETIVKVLGCEKGVVILGFDADKDVPVNRLEIFKKYVLDLPPEDKTKPSLLARISSYMPKGIKRSFAYFTR